MKNERVTINLETYNDLRDFKVNMEEGFTCKIATIPYSNYSGETYTYISTNEAVEEIAKQNANLIEENKRILKRINEILDKYYGLKNEKFLKKDILEMNWWGFKKLKRKLKRENNG